MVAEVTGASESTVKAVLNGKRSSDSALGQTIQVADILLEEGLSKLLDEVKRVVSFPTNAPKTRTPK